MEKQPNVKLPIIFLSDYHNDPITGKPKCTLTIGLPTSTIDNLNKIDNGLFQKDIIYNCIHDENGNIVSFDNVGWDKHWNKRDIISIIGICKNTNVINHDICDPFVLKENNVYKMWYAGYIGSCYKIHYATSKDGISWANSRIVLDLGANGDTDDCHVWNPSVLKDLDGIYKMWYIGNDGSHCRIHYATSPNGIDWTKHGVVVDLGINGDTDSIDTCDPFVFKDSDGIYKMWYTGYDGSHDRIHYATSEDGINWIKHGVVVDVGVSKNTDDCHVWSPFVFKDSDGIYKMWYTGYDGFHDRIHYATSEDGINWTKHGVVVDLETSKDVDDIDIRNPFVLKDSDGTYKMWYTGFNGFHKRIYYATSPNSIKWYIGLDGFHYKIQYASSYNPTIDTIEPINESLHPLLRNPNVLIAGKSLTEDWGAKGLTITNGANNPYTFITREIQLESDDQNQLEVLVNDTVKDITGKLKQTKQQNLEYNHVTLQCSMI